MCDGFAEETTEHYLLHCPIYHLQLFDVLKVKISIFPLSNSYLTDLLLYGNNVLNTSTNKFIIQSVITSLLSTRIFNRPLTCLRNKPICFHFYLTYFVIIYHPYLAIIPVTIVLGDVFVIYVCMNVWNVFVYFSCKPCKL